MCESTHRAMKLRDEWGTHLVGFEPRTDNGRSRSFASLKDDNFLAAWDAKFRVR